MNSRLGAYYNQIVSVSSTKMNVQTSSYETVKRNRPRPRSCELRHDPKHSPDIPILKDQRQVRFHVHLLGGRVGAFPNEESSL